MEYPSLTKIWHNKSYPAISPSRPELSAKGKTITGGGTGIGAAISKAFAAAGSTQIAILGRTEKNLQRTKDEIEAEFPGTVVLAVPADITVENKVNDAFAKIYKSFGKINVFISNSGYQTIPTPALTANLEDWWATFNTNVLGALHSARGFIKYAAEGAALLHISSGLAHMPALGVGVSAYAASKAASTKLFEYIALENPELRVFNVQPGVVDSELNHKSDVPGEDDVNLPAHFAVWLTSPVAVFLSGKFVWANWDVDELKAREQEVLTTDLLDIKLGGLSFVGWKK